GRLRHAVAAGADSRLFEQEVHGLKQTAMEIGATNIADELFSLLLQFRKNQRICDVEHLAAELASFGNESKVRQLMDEVKGSGPA
ncbi:MAG TPA: hypothetical protein DDY32_15100, partial [Desulfobulbaceae bacterium]|nr:hypothetical protein [Desulfobulbaceae bacterium]